MKNAASQELHSTPSQSTDSTSITQANTAAFCLVTECRTSGRARVRPIFWSMS